MKIQISISTTEYDKAFKKMILILNKAGLKGKTVEKYGITEYQLPNMELKKESKLAAIKWREEATYGAYSLFADENYKADFFIQSERSRSFRPITKTQQAQTKSFNCKWAILDGQTPDA